MKITVRIENIKEGFIVEHKGEKHFVADKTALADKIETLLAEPEPVKKVTA